MRGDVLGFDEIDRNAVDLVGGKGAHLGELARIDGIRVPPGFCVTTEAFRRVMALVPSFDLRLDRLGRLQANDRAAIAALSAGLREAVEHTAIPDDLAASIKGALTRHGRDEAYAVRSSATAEDLPTASFAGQHDSYLDLVGPPAILAQVRRCWASLFTERAVTYRRRNGVDERQVQMAVVVQQMIAAEAAGILFTADPITGNRKVAHLEACFGLGEVLVSGRVTPDTYAVRDGELVSRSIAAAEPALTDAQVLRLVEIGRRKIEAHFGGPQDIEWCLLDDEFYIVQSRPITTLFPIPTAGDDENHVYISVGHHQMMTDAMKPLGISFFQRAAGRPMSEAGGRLFVDVSGALASPQGRAGLAAMAGKSDPLVGDALQRIADRGFIPTLAADAPAEPPPGTAAPIPPLETDPTIVTGLIERGAAAIAAAERAIETRSGAALLDFIEADFQDLKRILFDPQSHQVIMAGFEATWWLNDHLQEWLGEKNAADTLTQSVPHNITSQMGLALLDVADAIRRHPEVVAFLQQVENDDFLDEMSDLSGGPQARDAIQAFLDEYGMRCVGEIDVTRPRWSENPSALVPVILGNVRNFETGAGGRRFEGGRREALAREMELLARLRALPDGEQKAAETKRMIDRVRTFAGYREYPKYGMVSRTFVYKRALMKEAERLVKAGILAAKEDVFYLRFEELQDVVRTGAADDALIRARREAFESDQTLQPPRVLTSEGEVIVGTYHRDDLPEGALVGLAVSAGTVEGRARVILDIAEASLEVGDILVTAFTDPSWTPLFVTIDGLVTEVGGLMTHGAVIAREYGLPAVVGVENATRLIEDGQRIRVHGTDGYVEILPTP